MCVSEIKKFKKKRKKKKKRKIIGYTTLAYYMSKGPKYLIDGFT